jgi:hypothetical protein
MLLGLDVLPEYRRQGLATEIVARYVRREKEKGRRKLILTCLNMKVEMYRKMGFADLGIANSSWGGEEWHEMTYEIASEESSDYITTYGGTHFYPTNPKPEDIHITDIAHALSLICRGNGHVKTFFSVGQHCINCALEAEARGAGGRLILACLLHDASECYMSDVPRPFKKTMVEYQKQEEYLLQMIYQHFLGSALTEDEQKFLKQIDDDLLYYDLKELLNEPPEGEAPVLHIDLNYEVQPFETVEKNYLQLYERYQKQNA